MATNKALSAQKSRLYVSTVPQNSFDPNDYTLVDGVTSFPFGPGQSNTLDASDLESDVIENIPALPGGQTVQVSGNRWPVGQSPGQEILLEADPVDDLYFLMTLPTGDAAKFVAKVATFNVAPGVNQVLTFTADLLPRAFERDTGSSS